jgi:Family of unknown function (DUF5681)
VARTQAASALPQHTRASLDEPIMTAAQSLRTAPPIDVKPKRKVWGRPFQKGQSGNPGGKRKEPENVGELLRRATPEAYATLVDIMNTKSNSAAVRAYCAEKLLDRAVGKPQQTTNLNVSSAQRSIKDLSDTELMSIIEAGRARAALPAPSAPPTIDVEPSVEPSVNSSVEPERDEDAA